MGPSQAMDNVLHNCNMTVRGAQRTEAVKASRIPPDDLATGMLIQIPYKTEFLILSSACHSVTLQVFFIIITFYYTDSRNPNF